VPEPELPQRLTGGIGRHVGPAVDDHPAEQIATHMHRPGQPLGQQLGDRGLARRLDAGDEQDGAAGLRPGRWTGAAIGCRT
jgi:hypothetical protein